MADTQIAKKTVNKLVDLIFRGLNKIIDGMNEDEIRKVEEEDIQEDGIDGKLLEFNTNTEHIIHVKLFGVDAHPGKYIIRISHDDDQDMYESEQLISDDEVLKFMYQYMDEYDLYEKEDDEPSEGSEFEADQDDAESLESSNKIQVTLKRISASSDVTVCAINPGSNISSAMSILDDVLRDEEFVNSLSEQPQSFEIVPSGDEYELSDIEDVDISSTYSELFSRALMFEAAVLSVYWGARGDQTSQLKNLAESMLWQAREYIMEVGKWYTSTLKAVPDIPSHTHPSEPMCPNGCEYSQGVDILNKTLSLFMEALECYYPNADHLAQAKINEWMLRGQENLTYQLNQSLLD